MIRLNRLNKYHMMVMVAVLLAVGIMIPYFTPNPKPAWIPPLMEPLNSNASGDNNGVMAKRTNNGVEVENAKYKMIVDDKFGQIRMISKTSGKEWGGIPALDPKSPSNNILYASTPITIKYISGSGGISETYPGKEPDSVTKVLPIHNGVRIDLDLPSLQFKLAVEYHLTDDGFEVRIPWNSVKEDGKPRLMGLVMLPFFSAAGKDEKGAIVVPDGSGALMKFDPNRLKSFYAYRKYVYGGDYAFLSKVYKVLSYEASEIIGENPAEQASLPIFGLYNGDKAFLGIISGGDTDAYINAVPEGTRNIPLYRTFAELNYRNDDIAYVGTAQIPMFQRIMIPGDRTIQYVLLEQKQANYVAMAQAYGEYLNKTEGLKSSDFKEIPLELTFFGGVHQTNIIANSYISMTSFKQAQEMLQNLLAKGIRSIEVTYDAWSGGGLYGKQPQHFPAESRLGGDADLQAFIQYAVRNNVTIYLKTNYINPYESSKALKPSRDAIRGLNRKVLDFPRMDMATSQPTGLLFYLMKPLQAYNSFFAEELGLYKQTGASGLQLGNIGELLYSDQNPEASFTRRQTKDTWVKSMDGTRLEIGRVAVDYGNKYALGHVDRIDQVPLNSSQYVYMDEAIPFYQIAVHGRVPYVSKPLNLADDPRIAFLKNLEYGAVPSFVITYEDPVMLHRSMMNELYNAQFDQVVNSVVDYYRKSKELLDKVANLPISNHEKLDNQVYRTTFGGDIQVIVNYGQKAAQVDNIVIDPYGYKIVEGGRVL
ncbi:MAG TPA: DUF5696 domain-containing protein [Bacilli bacterium]